MDHDTAVHGRDLHPLQGGGDSIHRGRDVSRFGPLVEIDCDRLHRLEGSRLGNHGPRILIRVRRSLLAGAPVAHVAHLC